MRRWAQQALEIIPLRHRTVEQVLPVLRPLLEPGGTLSGSRGQLILRASPANLAEIRARWTPSTGPRGGCRSRCASTTRWKARAATSRPAARISNRGAQRRACSAAGLAPRRGRAGRPAHPGARGRRGPSISDRASPTLPQMPGSRRRAASRSCRAHRAARCTSRSLQQRATRRTRMQSARVAPCVRARLGEWVELGGARGARSRATTAASVRRASVYARANRAASGSRSRRCAN